MLIRLVASLALLMLVPLALACDEGNQDDDEIPFSEVPRSPLSDDTELVFDGTIYKPVGFIAFDDAEPDELEQVGTAEKVSLPEFEGEVPVYVRDDDEEGIITPPVFGESDELWARWLPFEQTD